MEQVELLEIKRRLKPWIPESLLTEYRRRRARASFRQLLRPTDVFLVGHPKSGNTWLAYMLAIILHEDSQHKVTLANVRDYVPVVHSKDYRIGRYSHLPDPRMFRNESPVYPELYPRTIYLVRDPRAAVVSYYHMYRAISGNTGMPLEAFLEEYLSHGCIRDWEPDLVRWDRQVLSWLKRAQHDKRVMIVRYEDMARDRQAVLERVVKFAAIPHTENDLALAVARGSFEAMRKDEEEHGAESYRNVKTAARFIRRGKTDGWKEEMTPELAKRLEQQFASAMMAAGYLNRADALSRAAVNRGATKR